jgi:formylglycine-generating enzyme required for sulfatase activity
VPKVYKFRSKGYFMPPSDELSIEISADVSLTLLKIPAGEFTFGSGETVQSLTLDEFYIGKSPLTNEQYSEFLQATNRVPPDHWVGRLTPPYSILTHPVAGVDWRDALAFVEWLSDLSGKNLHLPSEAQWEKAARSTDGRVYPWGNDWVELSGVAAPPRIYIGDDTWVQVRTLPVGSTSPQTDSPYGCTDMCRNVWEWCSSAKKELPYNLGDGREDLANKDGLLRVLRGATFDDQDHPNAALRRFAPAHESRDVYGFRVALG